jgi:hypothetical protein
MDAVCMGVLIRSKGRPEIFCGGGLLACVLMIGGGVVWGAHGARGASGFFSTQETIIAKTAAITNTFNFLFFLMVLFPSAYDHYRGRAAKAFNCLISDLKL